MKVISKLHNVVNSVMCVQQGEVFCIRIRKGGSKNYTTVAACYDEFHARSIMRWVREMYGLVPGDLEKGDFFFIRREKSVKAYKILKEVGFAHDPRNWEHFAAEVFSTLPGVLSGKKKPRKKVLAALTKEINSTNGNIIRRKSK